MWSKTPWGHEQPCLVISAKAELLLEPKCGPFLRRREVTPEVRRILTLTVDYEIPLPLPGVPWIVPETMRRFLTGGGPLDREIELGGRRALLFEHLHELPPRDNRLPTRTGKRLLTQCRAIAGSLGVAT